MRLEEFLFHFVQSWQIYLTAFAIVAVFVYVILKRYYISLIDPFCLALVGVLFANTVPVFLYLSKTISSGTFGSFLIVEVAFWLGFFINKRQKNRAPAIEDNEYTYILFVISAFIVIAAKGLYYATQGFPIFFDSRIDKYANAVGGLGIIDRIIFILSIFCSIWSFKYFNSKVKYKKNSSRLYLIVLLGTFILDGSKSAFIGLLTPYFFYVYYIKRVKIKFGKVLLLIGGIISVALLIIMITSGSEGSSLLSLGHRFLMYGDVYYEGLVDDNYRRTVINHPVNDLLVNILAPFRIMDYSANVDIAPSLQIHRMVYPEMSDVLIGPNNRVPFLSLTLFDMPVAFFSAFFLGFLSSLFMFKTESVFRHNVVGVSLYCSLYGIGCSFITDPILALGQIPSFVISYCFLCGIYTILKYGSR